MILVIVYILGAVITIFTLELFSDTGDWGLTSFDLIATLLWPLVWLVIIPTVISAHLASDKETHL